MSRLPRRAAVAAAVLLGLALPAHRMRQEQRQPRSQDRRPAAADGAARRPRTAGQEATKLAQAAGRRRDQEDRVQRQRPVVQRGRGSRPEPDARGGEAAEEAEGDLRRRSLHLHRRPDRRQPGLVPADIPVISPAASADTLSQLHGRRPGQPHGAARPRPGARARRPDESRAEGRCEGKDGLDRRLRQHLRDGCCWSRSSSSWKKLGGKIAATVVYKDKSDYAGEVQKADAEAARRVRVLRQLGYLRPDVCPAAGASQELERRRRPGPGRARRGAC